MAKATHSRAAETAVIKTSNKLLNWLIDDALPVWSTKGVDRQYGGFYEALELLSGEGCTVPKRARVQPRQIYSFVEAGRLGWNGPVNDLVGGGLDWYLEHYGLEDGLIAAAVAPDGAVTDTSFDLYNHSFALFGLSQAAEVLPERKTELLARSRDMLAMLHSQYGHAERGFREKKPDEAPLCSNPHMHMFEASLALEQIDASGPWLALSNEIAGLAMDCFIDPVNGGLREFFDLDWSPMPDDRGRVMEPGHQFEWAWLLVRWGTLRGDARALQMARRLYQIGATRGIDADRQVAIMALNDDFSVRDPLARLWGQTEWIKAAVALAAHSTGIEREVYLQDIIRSSDALFLYFDAAPTGLWKDKLRQDGSFVDEPAPASSFYHIVCAIAELGRFAKTLVYPEN
ncbi:AGE family epimerase/isomerase [Labrenzia sp. CE80]|uniref:AGE family epimerase/isomerase n=1 Tax=Labrenzia sp. CE80 TaxID=1788986 RepID=UPI00129A2F33|nr:AGE family epimerase/isomerase [Labrenzia sp. CE80]